METQAFGTLLFGKDIQRQLILHIARDEKVLATARSQLVLTDFTWEVCQVVLHALYNYYDAYHKLPNPDVLAYELKQLITGERGQTIAIYEADLNSLADLMYQIHSVPASALSSEWALNTLGEYQTQVRLRKANIDIEQVLRTGVGTQEVAKSLGNVVVDNASRTAYVSDMFDMQDVSVYQSDVKHVTTGLATMDKNMAGGLMPAELVLIAACQGVGKTNLMLNLGLSTIIAGWDSCFISLEMPAKVIKDRSMAMGAHIPAMKFNGPLQDFGVDELQRLERIKQKMTGRYACIDCSNRSVNYAGIERMVMEWMDQRAALDRQDKAGIICIDYLDEISHAQEYGRGKSDLDPEVLKHLMGSMKKLANRTQVPIIIATQANRAADGVQLFHRRHVSWGFNKIDAIDWGFGIAEKEDMRVSNLNNDDDDVQYAESAGITTNGRKLIVSSFKQRRGDAMAFDVFQAPTLRLYNTRGDYNAAEANINGTKVF